MKSIPGDVSSARRSAIESVFETIVAGTICGFLAIVLSISFGGLLLPAVMQNYLHAAIGMAVFSTAVSAAISALLSSIRGSVSIVQEIPTVAIAGMASFIAVAMAGETNPTTMFVTIVAATALATVGTGATLLLLGFFRLGNLIRFVPFPVIGGFLAGTGWLIFQGGVSIVAGKPVDFATLSALWTPAMLGKAAAVIVLIGAIALLQARSKSELVQPAISFAGILLFNVVTVVAGVSHGTLDDAGWLVPLPQGHALWPPIAPSDLAQVNWSTVLAGMIALPGIIGVAVMAILMNATGIELESGRDVDLDAEMRSVGVQNLVAGLGGGMPGYPAVSLTLLAERLGGANRGVGLIVAGMAAASIFFGDFILSIVPTPLLGGLLLWVGGALMLEWLVLAARRLMLREYAIIVLIFAVIVGVSFPFGILVGLVAAIALFVLEYGRVDTIRYALRGSEYQSNMEGSEERLAALRRHGDAILILRLQGYLFFGTAERLRKKALEAITAKDGTRVRFVLIDFQRVTGLDSSAALSFVRLLQSAARDGFTVVATGSTGVVKDALRRAGIDPAKAPALRFETDIEAGLAWCENTLLDDIAPEIGSAPALTFAKLINRLLKDGDDVARLQGYFERVEISTGQILIAQGAPSDDIYFIERGRASVTVGGIGGVFHLAHVSAGAVVGEVAFYLGRPRTASVVADEPVTAWRFTRAALRRMETELPATAFRLHEGLAAMLADRLSSTNRLVRFFAD